MQVEGVFKVRRTPNQEKALWWYAQEHGLIPQLSTHPYYYFKDSEDNERKVHIFNITLEWEHMRKETKRGKGRL